MTSPSRRQLRVARKEADRQGRRLVDLPRTDFITSVSTVAVGAALNGSTAVWVLWRGTEIQVDGKSKNYTPVEGDRVVCRLVSDQLLIAHAIDGQPI